MKTPPTMIIDGRTIGPSQAPYVIAELSGNHMGDKENALNLLRMAAGKGADAVKLQTYTPDTMTIDFDGPGFTVEGGLWDGRSLYDLYQEAQTPWEWHADLFELGRELGVSVFSSPFDETAVDFLETLDCPAYKIASFEALDIPLIEKAASTGKPLIVSMGLITADDADAVLRAARTAGAPSVALLHCVSAYPAPVDGSNVRAIAAMADRYDAVVGLSDHTLGTAVAVAAVSLGAAVVEKHVCMSRAAGGVDSAFALEPDELSVLVEDCRSAWLALGNAHIGRQKAAEASAEFRRSLYVIKDIPAGASFTRENVRSIRPGYGLPPGDLANIIGRIADRDLPRGTPLSWSDVKGPKA